MNILLLRIDKLGDFILSIEPILQLKKSHPDCNIDFVVNKTNYALAKSLGIFKEIIVIDHNSSKIKNLINFIKYTKRKNYEYVIDLLPGTNHFSSILQLLVRAPNKVGIAVGLRKYFLTKKLKVTKIKYETELVYDILKGLITKKSRRVLFSELKLSEKEKKTYKKICDLYNLKPRKYICIYPIIEKLEKKRQWSFNNYAGLIEKLLSHFPNTKIVITGSNQDNKYVKHILKKIMDRRIINLTGKLNLIGLVRLLNGCLFSLGGLTGPSHISAVVCRRPTFCIVGGTTIERWVSENYSYIVIKKSPKCFPCEHLKGCVNSVQYKCLKELSVQEVMADIKKSIK